MFDLTKHLFLNGNILVEPIEPETDMWRPSQYEDKPTWGRVINSSDTDTYKIGSVVLFGEFSTTKYRLNGKDYMVLPAEDVISIYHD